MPTNSHRSPALAKVCAACLASGVVNPLQSPARVRRKTGRLRAAAWTLGVSALLMGQSARATTYTYSGQTGSTTTPTTGTFIAGFNGNGTSGYATPTSGASTILAFGGPSGDDYTATDDLTATFNIGGLTFSNAGNVTVALGAGTTLTEAQATAIALNNSGSLNFGLNITNGGYLTTFSGTGVATFSGAINGTGGVTLGGSETVTLSGTNGYTGTTTVGTGTTLIVSGSLASTTVGVTGTLQLQATGANTSGSPAVSAAIGSAALTLNSGATLQLRADADTSFAPASITAASGTVTIDVNQLTSGNGSHTLSLGGVNNATNATTTFNITGGNGDILSFGNVSLNSSSGGPYTTTFNATTAAATIGTLTSGSYGTAAVFSGSNNITLGSFVENSNSTNSLTVSGANLTITGATTSAGNRQGGGAFAVTLNSGTLNLNNASVLSNPNTGNGTTFTITGGNLDNTSGAAITESSTSNKITGDFIFNPNAVTGTTHNLTLQGGVNVVGNRTVTVDAGTLTISGGAYGSGTYGVTQAGAGTLTLGGFSASATANSTVQLAASAGTFNAGGVTTGAGSGVQATASGGTLNLGGLSLSATGGNAQLAATAGTLNVGSLSHSGGGGIVSFSLPASGTITTTTANTNGILGAYAITGSGTGLSYVTDTGSSSPYTVGAFTTGTTLSGNFGGTSGSGITPISSGTNYNFSSSITESNNGTANTLRYTGTGDTITIPNGDKLTTAGIMNAGTGTLTINGPTASSQGQGVGAGNGTVSELVVTGNTQGIVFNAGLTNNYNNGSSSYNTSSVTFATQGTVTLNNLNYYTGVTGVNSGTLIAGVTNTLANTSGVTVASGAMFSLAANSALATPITPTTTSTAAGTPGTATGQVPITLGGGTLLRNGAGINLGSGTTVGAGALTLTAASTLDFGTTGAGTLNFNSFVDASNFTLTVSDYNNLTKGARVDGTDDRLIFNEQLTTAQLADISFGGVGASQINLGNSEWEILPGTAVPEPSTWVGGLFFIGMACGARLRRVLSRAVA